MIVNCVNLTENLCEFWDIHKENDFKIYSKVHGRDDITFYPMGPRNLGRTKRFQELITSWHVGWYKVHHEDDSTSSYHIYFIRTENKNIAKLAVYESMDNPDRKTSGENWMEPYPVFITEDLKNRYKNLIVT